MTLDTNLVSLVVHVDKGDLDSNELSQLTRDLQTRLESTDIESVDLMREQAPHPGTKAVDPVTVGALTVVVVQAVLPKVLDFLQAWSLRNQGQTVRVKVQHGNESVEAEFSGTTDPDKIKQYIEIIVNPMRMENKQH